MVEHPSAYISVTDSGTTFKISHCPFHPPVPDEKYEVAGCECLTYNQHVYRASKDFYYVPSAAEFRPYRQHSEVKGDNVESIRKSFNRLKAVINTNCDDVSKVLFVTLTYKENMQDVARLRKDMYCFFRRLKAALPVPFEYIYVKEKQARGAWHVHMFLLFNSKAPYLSENDITELWGLGFSNVQAIKGDINNVGNYLCAYLTDAKEGSKKGARLLNYETGIRLYNCSRGVKRPVKYSVSYDEYCDMIADADVVAVSEHSRDLMFSGGRVAGFTQEIYRRL